MTNPARTFLIGVFFTLLGTAALAQSAYVLESSPALEVAGSSTIHDWTMESTRASGNAEFVVENSSVANIQKVEVTMPVKSLKSGKKSMDGNAYEALLAAKHPNIHFEFVRVISNRGAELTIEGKLTVAGQTRTVRSKVNLSVQNGVVRAEGSFVMTFSAFGLEPPTAVFGTIKTGDELLISYDLTFRPK